MMPRCLDAVSYPVDIVQRRSFPKKVDFQRSGALSPPPPAVLGASKAPLLSGASSYVPVAKRSYALNENARVQEVIRIRTP